MILLVRFFLVGLIIYLIVRSFARYGKDDEPPKIRREPENGTGSKNKGVSKSIGEYVDYEELDK
jgi:hypothetical protein